MKLNFGQRLLLIVHWILSLIGCLLAALLLITPNTVYGMIDGVYASIGKRAFDTVGIVLCAIYILIAAGCATMIFSGFGKRGERGLITVFSNDTGKTRIAVSAVEQMARQAIAGVDGISDVRATITGAEDAIGVNISLVLKRGAYLPTVTNNIQRTVRGYIEQNCGVAVQSIIVNVRAVEGEAPNAGKDAKTETPVGSSGKRLLTIFGRKTVNHGVEFPVLTVLATPSGRGLSVSPKPSSLKKWEVITYSPAISR